MFSMERTFQSLHNHQAQLDYALASTLVGGAYMFHVDLAMVNSSLAMLGGFLGVALAGARLYYFLKEKWYGRSDLDNRG